MGVLARSGGLPVTTGSWPPWPQSDEASVTAVTEALGSGRWTLTGGWTGTETYERRFARRFADYVGVPWCVTADHGSTALVLALEALGVGAGDEVVVPVLTWVATATAVLEVNALPVFVDVDPATGCMDPVALSEALNERTAAVIPVHLHCRMADMDAISAVCHRAGVPVVEDCAQAHGARWRGGRMAGSLGALGAFSMQQGKVLTCGEGGAVTTTDEGLYDRLVQLRSDSRRYREGELALGHPGLCDVGEIMGANRSLSELPAALLLDQLDRLEGQVAQRAAAADVLDGELRSIDGLAPLGRPAGLDRPSVFEYAVRRDPAAFAGAPTDVLCAALEAELGVRVMRTDRPLHQNVLYCPRTKEKYRPLHHRLAAAEGASFPAAEELYENLVLLPHRVLLAGQEGVARIVEAFSKVAAHADEL